MLPKQVRSAEHSNRPGALTPRCGRKENAIAEVLISASFCAERRPQVPDVLFV
jgi:hypothetical protein